jgi:glycosyltransferase involved in cell wall biosynthesis
LHEQAQALGLTDTVEFVRAVSLDRLPLWYARCAVSVNLSPIGSGDKVVWEALACGKLCLFANGGFTPTFGAYAECCRFSHGNPQHLAERLMWALSLSHDERATIGACLRERVVSMHGLDRLAQILVELFQAEVTHPRYVYRQPRRADEMRREHG